ncbi:uncharacterized protein T551_02087 [Pneumocystis jirovecii RU7]|uniref:Uncharacterized protein n=1 Tax=Pneumocystis jirovecii (strain RU7) TaxID=1408657 RepID=A0A0W4ZM77_PNEJ7|nr:uncharacterized protein T551_02087 [Pneumocystis jirovecii RU7]KTW29471.1 hypothetical protein T551_02087 [Pneumocystis jirovecii RU7]
MLRFICSFKAKNTSFYDIFPRRRVFWTYCSSKWDLNEAPLPFPINKFPFIFKHAKKAPTRPSFFPVSKGLKPMTYIFDSLQQFFASYISYSSAETRFGHDYWPNEFCVGGTYATRQFFHLLKEPKSKLSKIMTEDLLLLLDDYITKDGQPPLKLRPYIYLNRVYNSKIRTVFVNFGSKDTFKRLSELEKLNERDPRYIRVRWKTFNIGLKLAPDEKDIPTSFTITKNAALREMKKGISYSVDLEIDGEFETGYFDSLDEKDSVEPKIVNRERRIIVVTFQSQHCDPGSRLSVENVFCDDELVNEGVEWKISDIDYVIFEKKLEEITRYN